MQVTRVHFLKDEEGQVVWMDTTWGSIDIAMPISEAMAKCLATDIHNRVADGHGHVAPTPWGWYWVPLPAGGHLPVPLKRSEILQDIIVATDVVPLYHPSLLERR